MTHHHIRLAFEKRDLPFPEPPKQHDFEIIVVRDDNDGNCQGCIYDEYGANCSGAEGEDRSSKATKIGCYRQLNKDSDQGEAYFKFYKLTDYIAAKLEGKLGDFTGVD
jgi:hypothetical protein